MVSNISLGKSFRFAFIDLHHCLFSLSLLYGFSQPSSIYYYYRHYSFYYRADENGIKLPKIHLILCKASESKSHSDDLEKYWRFIYEIYNKHRDAFESRPSFEQTSNSLFSNHLSQLIQIETFEEFLEQYVMHIAHETNVVSRMAVKSHSPLLNVKHPHPTDDYQSTVQTFDKTLNDIVERI